MSDRILTGAVMDSIHVTTASAGPARRRNRPKPSRFAPVLHLSGLVVACAAVLALFAR